MSRTECWLLYVILPAMILVSMFVRQRQEALVGLGFIAVLALVYFAIQRRWRKE